MRTKTFALFFITLVRYSYQKSTPNSDSYVAAVVEFSPNNPTSSGDPPIQQNSARYVSFIEKAAKQNADIIVFPEAGLTSIEEPERDALDTWSTIVPAPPDNYVPCIHATIPVSEALKVISCSARANMLYVVINLAEKVICTKEGCPSDRRLYYNTNVVFDREGKIIARYRKTNLCVEPAFNVTEIPELVTFDTDFGVTFGTFICFDVLFKKPAMYLTRMLNVTDVVFPTAWFSELPFLTALQVQVGWSYAEDANFLVSGYSRPKSANAGSGIYLGRQGIAKAIIPGLTTNEMLIAVVPKKHRQGRPRYEYDPAEANRPVDERRAYPVDEEQPVALPVKSSKIQTSKEQDQPENIASRDDKEDAKYLTVFHEDISSYKSHQFNSSISQTLCAGDFCCDFNVEIVATRGDNETSSKYRMIVHDGTRTFLEPVIIGLGVCAIVRCSNETLESCGYLEKNETTIFNALTINATFPNYEDVLVIPSSLGTDLFPLANWHYEERWNEKKLEVSASLTGPTGNLVTCGIYGRDFSRDTREKKNIPNS